MRQTFDFDRIIDRSNTYSVKHDPVAFGRPADTIPLWVADMDFQAPPCVLEALSKQVSHGIFGYSDADAAYIASLQGWFSRRFDWTFEPDWLVKTPGIVIAVHMALRSLTQSDDAILIQEPVYYPFRKAIEYTGRTTVVNELRYENGAYSIDFVDFEEKIAENNVKMFILCNPHNPIGRVWSRAELVRMGDICQRHGVLVIADEIHQDFIYPGHKHEVFLSLNPAYHDFTVACTAPSKTFNLAGLQLSNIFIPNPDLRKAFKAEYRRCGMSEPSLMGIAACKAAYDGGEDWLEQLLDYLTGNLDFLRSYLQAHLPAVRLVEPEGTYLVWLDFSALGMSDAALDALISHKARLWLDDGLMFGASGSGFQRVNIACPRSVLAQALDRLVEALK